MKAAARVCFFILILSVLVTAVDLQAACPGALGSLRATSGIKFGTVPVGSSSSQNIVLTNVNTDSSLNVKSITPLDSQYSIVSPKAFPFCLTSGQSIQIQVIFAPTQAGNADTKLRISSSDPLSPFFVSVFAAATGGGGAAKFSVSPTSLDFGQVKPGQSLTKTFNILNQGNAAGTIDQVTSSNNAFGITTAFPKSIPAGSQAPVSVKFAPSKNGSYNGTISVKSGNSTVGTVAVIGTGASGNPDILLGATRLDFGTFPVGTFIVRTLKIQNVGESDLEVSFLPAVQLVLTPGGPLTIGPGKSVQVQIRWIADAMGPLNKMLNIKSNDPDEPMLDVGLMANGIKGKIGFLNTTAKSHVGNNMNDTTGVQWIDFNGDGKEDLYLTGHDGNILYKNMGGGQFANVTQKSRTGNMGRDCRGASWADVDNDGDPDLFLSNFNGPSSILKNNMGVFISQNQALGLFTADNTPAAEGGIWLDFNNDSRLDLFIVKSGKPNQLFKQTGIFRFTDVAASAGVNGNAPGVSAVAADFNADGYQDLYVANLNRPNKLYINNKNETFRDATQSAGVGFNGASRQAVVSDYDGDGDLDLFVVNSDGGSVLYRNTGNLKFQNATAAAGLTGPKKASAASFADVDNDGDVDLLLMQPSGQNLLFVNNGHGRFARAANVDISSPSNPSSTSTGDSNNDGTPDVATGDSTGAPDTSYQNTGGDSNNWLVLVLQGTESNRSAIGAKVLLRTGALFQAKVVSAGNGQSQDSLPLEFGLGGASSATIIIGWPSGKIQTLENVTANQKLKITEPVN